MKKYRVVVNGKNLLAKVDGIPRRLGFYTNVFIEAFTPADAESRAIEIIREDAHLQEMILNAKDDPLSLSATEVLEIESFDGARLPRTGLSLYQEEKT